MRVLHEAGQSTPTAEATWVEHLRVADLSCGTYSIPVGGGDPQEPHTEDELYLCTRGRATLWTPSGSTAVEVGTVVFVPAGEEHRFVDVEQDLTVFVVFGPAEDSRKSEGNPRG
jgi:mannose-6-phosphate isomerase-like protein (cupin superfamily)